jgi:hypothetical protein
MLEVRRSGGLRDDARQSNVLDSSWFLVMTEGRDDAVFAKMDASTTRAKKLQR